MTSPSPSNVIITFCTGRNYWGFEYVIGGRTNASLCIPCMNVILLYQADASNVVAGSLSPPGIHWQAYWYTLWCFRITLPWVGRLMENRHVALEHYNHVVYLCRLIMLISYVDFKKRPCRFLEMLMSHITIFLFFLDIVPTSTQPSNGQSRPTCIWLSRIIF